MLLLRLKTKAEEMVFINRDFPAMQFRQELDQYVTRQNLFKSQEEREEYTEVLLKESKSLQMKIEILVKIPTKLIAQSGHAEEIQRLYKGDKLTVYSDVSYKIRRSLLSRIRIFFKY